MTVPSRYSLYKAVWYWKDDHLSYHSSFEGKERTAKTQTKQTQESPVDTLLMLETVDQNQQKLFRLKCQRSLKPNVPNIITMQDIKDVVMFLTISPIPTSAFEVFLSYEINRFLRALIVYLQLYLQVKDDLVFRRKSYSLQRLKHPISVERETMCRRQLIRLRSRIGQEYSLIITGEGKYKKHHHMNNNINRSYTLKDLELFDYLIKLSARVAWIALYRSNYKEIEHEVTRLVLNYKTPKELITKGTVLEALQNESDRMVLYGDEKQIGSHWRQKSPVIADLFLNQEITDLVCPQNFQGSKETLIISGLEAALTLPEELLEEFQITIGILGQSKDKFETMLNVKQAQPKTLEEEELEYLLTQQEKKEKPSVKMYQYLDTLQRDLNLRISFSEDVTDIKEEIEYYTSNHVEDSEKAYKLWKTVKCYF